jgi:hypothetical protein
MRDISTPRSVPRSIPFDLLEAFRNARRALHERRSRKRLKLYHGPDILSV